jgi:hypothetical protein
VKLRWLVFVVIVLLVIVTPVLSQGDTNDPDITIQTGDNTLQFGRTQSATQLLTNPGGRVIKEVPEWAEFALAGESRLYEGATWWPVSLLFGAEGAGWLPESVMELALEESTPELRLYADETCMSSPTEAKWLRGLDLLRRYQHALIFPEEVQLMEVRPANLFFAGEIQTFEAGVDPDLNAALLPATWVARQSVRFRGPNWDDEYLWQLHWVCELPQQ